MKQSLERMSEHGLILAFNKTELITLKGKEYEELYR